MKIEIFSICDAATEGAGKLNLLGGFDTLHAGAAPIRHPACSVVVRLRFFVGEEGRHQFCLRFIDSDGSAIGKGDLKGQIGIQFPPHADSATANIIVNLQNLEFPDFGEYRVDLLINDELVGSLPVFVRQMNRPKKSA